MCVCMHACMCACMQHLCARPAPGVLRPDWPLFAAGRPCVRCAVGCAAVGTGPTSDAAPAGRAGDAKPPPRPGKRERTRMRLRQQGSLRRAAAAAAPASVPVDQAQSSTRALPALSSRRRLLSERRASGESREGEAPVSKVPEILAMMRNTSAAEAFRRILLDPVEGLPDDAELTEIYLRYERGLPLSPRLAARQNAHRGCAALC